MEKERKKLKREGVREKAHRGGERERETKEAPRAPESTGRKQVFN